MRGGVALLAIAGYCSSLRLATHRIRRTLNRVQLPFLGLPGRAPRVLNRAGQALRQTAANARNNHSFIGASHRARLARMDGAVAVKATAHQLARILYAMLTKGQPYVEHGLDAFEARSRDRQLRALHRKAHKLGLQLVEAA